ncbi:hypothetical protein G6F56_010091 [Rhizopus delemar]|nr:hypothetical protein G6F56_010091 [Rhizopus delemar]
MYLGLCLTFRGLKNCTIHLSSSNPTRTYLMRDKWQPGIMESSRGNAQDPESNHDIKAFKRARNLMVDNEEREIEAAKIKEMKQKCWTEIQSLHTLRRELKDAKNTDVNAIHNFGQMKFSESDYGLKTMSVTVEILPEVFSSHLSYYNKLHLENPL